MSASNAAKSFASYLEKSWKPSDITRVLLVYVRLLLLFRTNLPEKALGVLLERQKQLRGEPFNDFGFEAIRKLTRGELDRRIGADDQSAKSTMLNRLLFCAMIDGEETDVFYLTEPIVEFVRTMAVPSVELQRILESEFVGFRTEV
jgi:hypothetical protein